MTSISTPVYSPLIAFAGPKFAGKGTAAKLPLSAGYKIASFARPLKDMLVAMGLTEVDLTDPVLKETPHPLLGGQTPRYAMQTLGTQWGRETIWDDIWVNLMSVRLRTMLADGGRFVFDDCRFDNEAIALRQSGAVIIEITNPKCSYNPAIKSEAGLSRHLITATVANDSTIEDLHVRLSRALIDLELATAA